jgi:hypothetical protein
MAVTENRTDLEGRRLKMEHGEGYSRVNGVHTSCVICGKDRKGEGSGWVTEKDGSLRENRRVHLCSTRCQEKWEEEQCSL